MQARSFLPSRRDLLRGGAAAGGGILFLGLGSASVRVWPRPLGSEEEEDGNVLVVLELAGGNDGLSTVVPYGDDAYLRARRRLSIPPGDVLKLDEYRGLNSLLSGLKRHYDAGRMAVVEGAGYPGQSRSHFASSDVWHTADVRGRLLGHGWLGRTLEVLRGRDGHPGRGVYLGGEPPFSLRSAGDVAPRCAAAGASSGAVRAAAEAYTPRTAYPCTPLGDALRSVAALIQQRVGARILCARLPGFDTHVRQAERLPPLLAQWNDALSAFLDDVAGTPRGDRTLVLVHSEFGRRVAENASLGTDHGAAGPLFLFGTGVRGGLHGQHPSLVELDAGDLCFTTDFRSVFATLLKGWFEVEPKLVLAEPQPTLQLLA